MSKKILLIIGILVLVGIAAFLILTSKPQAEEGGRVGFSIRDFLPFGKSVDTDTDTETNTEEGSSDEEVDVPTNTPIPKLRKISSEPVAGSVIFNVGTTSIVRFVEKGTGNVYEVKSDSLKIDRLSNTTIPKIIRAFWLPNGSGFLAQTLLAESEIIETSLVKLNKNKESLASENLTPFGTTIGKLPTGIKEITIKPDGTKIFYYTTTGSSNWFVSNPDGTATTVVMAHPLTEWLPKWVSGNTIILQTKGSSEAISYAYSFDVSNKTLKNVGVGFTGLSINPNLSGSLSVISSGGATPQLFVVENKSTALKTLGVNSLAEKCVWLKEKSPTIYCAVPNQIPGGNYPDVWYKGLVSTEDYVIKIDIDNNITYTVGDFSLLTDQKIDATDLILSPDETHLVFRNKIDGFLWMLRLEE
ncbi:MAG: hypothetical protein A3A96_03110 [Candidatus Zambryskibacteria bacterium RIFCSPLOWO2_01_FULL_39_39]|uniref:Dipeptidylpeptidase IV N-terminal domain-containing protein n=1 Tax=Candidatus Zambryskibacteria bacterium RIFCSPLOWO2_01_FULL_39_39 TaxID=1802758 RepID=A0A1G2TYD0_9BACT|nr:MAG: hypothetical protein UT00_C0002G0003 [Parcubacteria group bacterium GW2011_GWA1_38_7]OHA87648.1 MAG: hypothetical protein A2644_02500 [Candidatus Zambryskibacteria bacterium RIFCSPHIGHO2_01_FULL_39_63]OHA94416.1 MAG: hypothetical protein A3B88_01815 [Candidatus Zambryskibacteria bacterium RIFCSPHIGHO2_02_FULL_39_19]OHA98772.1 MAG: hypothetical protein A3F20_00795 [Candidatus Zambryskibacteria bacterium RIFCSPHIGHO2_12_FULL_39_21]OHB01630.1 MAG: hypothetical protein A3A96_03110 [Candidat